MRLAVAAVAVTIVVTAVVDPRLAGALAFVVALVAAATALVIHAEHTRAVLAEPMAPFAPDLADTEPVVETPDVADLVREISQANRVIPPRVAADLRAAAAGRLLDEHRLDLGDIEDRERARDLLGADLGAIVFDDADGIPLDRLGRLIEEVDRL